MATVDPGDSGWVPPDPAAGLFDPPRPVNDVAPGPMPVTVGDVVGPDFLRGNERVGSGGANVTTYQWTGPDILQESKTPMQAFPNDQAARDAFLEAPVTPPAPAAPPIQSPDAVDRNRPTGYLPGGVLADYFGQEHPLGHDPLDVFGTGQYHTPTTPEMDAYRNAPAARVLEGAMAPFQAIARGSQMAFGALGLAMQAALQAEAPGAPGNTGAELQQFHDGFIARGGPQMGAFDQLKLAAELAGESWDTSKDINVGPHLTGGPLDLQLGLKGTAEFINPVWWTLPAVGAAGRGALVARGIDNAATRFAESFLANGGIPYADKAIHAALVNSFTRGVARQITSRAADFASGEFLNRTGGTFGAGAFERHAPQPISEAMTMPVERQRDLLGLTRAQGNPETVFTTLRRFAREPRLGNEEYAKIAGDVKDVVRQIDILDKSPEIAWGRLDPEEQFRQLAITDPAAGWDQWLNAYRNASSDAERQAIVASGQAHTDQIVRERLGTGAPFGNEPEFMRPGDTATPALAQMEVLKSRYRSLYDRAVELNANPPPLISDAYSMRPKIMDKGTANARASSRAFEIVNKDGQVVTTVMGETKAQERLRALNVSETVKSPLAESSAPAVGNGLTPVPNEGNVAPEHRAAVDQLMQAANALPPPAPGTVRLYRAASHIPKEGEPGYIAPAARDHWQKAYFENPAAGRWFTDNLDDARWYAIDVPNPRLHYIDVPEAEAAATRVSGPGGAKVGAFEPQKYSRIPDHEYVLEGNRARSAIPVVTDVAGPAGTRQTVMPGTPEAQAPALELTNPTVTDAQARQTRVEGQQLTMDSANAGEAQQRALAADRGVSPDAVLRGTTDTMSSAARARQEAIARQSAEINAAMGTPVAPSPVEGLSTRATKEMAANDAWHATNPDAAHWHEVQNGKIVDTVTGEELPLLTNADWPANATSAADALQKRANWANNKVKRGDWNPEAHQSLPPGMKAVPADAVVGAGGAPTIVPPDVGRGGGQKPPRPPRPTVLGQGPEDKKPGEFHVVDNPDGTFTVTDANQKAAPATFIDRGDAVRTMRARNVANGMLDTLSTGAIGATGDHDLAAAILDALSQAPQPALMTPGQAEATRNAIIAARKEAERVAAADAADLARARGRIRTVVANDPGSQVVAPGTLPSRGLPRGKTKIPLGAPSAENAAAARPYSNIVDDRSRGQKILDTLRALRTPFTIADVSGVERQGSPAVWAHPKNAWKAFQDARLNNAEQAKEVNRLMYESALASGHADLHIAVQGGGVIRGEERFAGTDTAALKDIPLLGKVFSSQWYERLVNRSEAFHVTFLNSLRLRTVLGREEGENAMRALVGRPPMSDAEKHNLDWVVNQATGRGFDMQDGGQVARAAKVIASDVLYSAQWQASRPLFMRNSIKGIAQVALHGSGASPADKEAARLAMGKVIELSTFYGVLKAGGLEIDPNPTSTNFGRINLGKGPLGLLSGPAEFVGLSTYHDNAGNTWIDPTAGNASYIRLIARTADIVATFARTGKLPGWLHGGSPGTMLEDFLGARGSPAVSGAYQTLFHTSQTDWGDPFSNPFTSWAVPGALQAVLQATHITDKGGPLRFDTLAKMPAWMIGAVTNANGRGAAAPISPSPAGGARRTLPPVTPRPTR